MAVASVAAEPFSLAHFLGWIDENELTLEDGADWVVEGFQQSILVDILARAEPSSFAPLHREVWALVPEGNAKTTLFAGAALYLADHTPTPWIPLGAAAREQADILRDQAGGFVHRSKSLRRRFRVYDGYRKIIHRVNGGRGIVVFAADKDTADGVIPFPIALVDEPHRHKDMSLYRLWKGKLNKRGAAIATLSTAGEPGSEFEEMREAIRSQATERERDGEHDCHLRAVGHRLVYHEWMVPRVEQARDLSVVKEANPLSTITPEYLAEKLASPTLDFGNDWLRLTCNIPTRTSSAAVPEADWDACETTTRITAKVPIMVGADFAWLEDTTAIVPLWVRSRTERLYGNPIVLEPPGDGTMLETGEVKLAFLELNDRNPVEVVVMDMSKAQDIAQWLSNELGCKVVDWSQGNDQAAQDYADFMEAVRERWISHTGDPTFRAHVMAAIKARLPGDRYRFDRPRTNRKAPGRQRRIVIDVLTAAYMVNGYAAHMKPKQSARLVAWS